MARKVIQSPRSESSEWLAQLARGGKNARREQKSDRDRSHHRGMASRSPRRRRRSSSSGSVTTSPTSGSGPVPTPPGPPSRSTHAPSPWGVLLPSLEVRTDRTRRLDERCSPTSWPTSCSRRLRIGTRFGCTGPRIRITTRPRVGTIAPKRLIPHHRFWRGLIGYCRISSLATKPKHG